MKNKTSEHSAEIKTEILQIVDAFQIGNFIEILSFENSQYSELKFIETKFKTTKGVYTHFYSVK